MKFNCGPTAQERREARNKYLKSWHRWFAWKPVRIGRGGTECRWLEFVYRKGEPRTSYYCDGWDWTYQAIKPEPDMTAPQHVVPRCYMCGMPHDQKDGGCRGIP